MIKIAVALGFIVLGLLITAIGVWGTLALTYLGPKNDILRYVLAAVFAVASLGYAHRTWISPLEMAYFCHLHSLVCGSSGVVLHDQTLQ